MPLTYSWALPKGNRVAVAQASEPEGDPLWEELANAPGVLRAHRTSAAKIATPTTTPNWNNWLLNDSKDQNVEFDTSIKPHPTAEGSVKINVLSADGQNSGNVVIYFEAGDHEEGMVRWISYRVKAPATFWFQSHDVSSADWTARGQKIHIYSHNTGSSVSNETVLQLSGMLALLRGYHQDGVSFINEDVGAVTDCSGSDFRWQFKVDNGANPLSGVNIDTGSAWSACEQDRAQFGGLYSSQSLQQCMRGLGDPLTGGFRPVPGEWVQIIMRQQIGTFATFSSRYTMWACHEEQPPEFLWDSKDIRLGDFDPPNTLHWACFRTNCIADGGRKPTTRTTPIAGVTPHTAGINTATGDGVLEYNASTQRFRWHSNGNAFGSARGFKTSNPTILFINVTCADQDGVCIEVDPALLPSSGTHTETITIATGMVDTQINYADVIYSDSIINGRGGYPPLGVSTLADTAGAMSPGDWQEMSATGLDLFTNATWTTGMVGYCDKMTRDPTTGRIFYIGCDHNTPVIFVIYDEATNTWKNSDGTTTFSAGKVPWGPASVGDSPPFHGYNHTAYVPLPHDEVFHRPYNTRAIRRWDGGTTWATFDYSSLVSFASTSSMAWFPELGQVIVFEHNGGTNTGICFGFDPASPGTRTTYLNGGIITPIGTIHVFCHYSPQHQCVVFGGGEDPVTTSKIWRLNSSGTVSLISDNKPGALGNLGPGGTTTTLITVNPATGNLLAIRDKDTWYDYDISTGGSAGTWTARGDTAQAWVSNTYAGTDSVFGSAAVPIPEYGGILFIKPFGTSPAEQWFWKAS